MILDKQVFVKLPHSPNSSCNVQNQFSYCLPCIGMNFVISQILLVEEFWWRNIKESSSLDVLNSCLLRHTLVVCLSES
jgi:hypothetical protein